MDAIDITDAVTIIILNQGKLRDAESGPRLYHAAIQYFHSQRQTFDQIKIAAIEPYIGSR